MAVCSPYFEIFPHTSEATHGFARYAFCITKWHWLGEFLPLIPLVTASGWIIYSMLALFTILLAPCPHFLSPLPALFAILLTLCLHRFSRWKSDDCIHTCTNSDFDCTYACTIHCFACTLPSPIFLPEIGCLHYSLHQHQF